MSLTKEEFEFLKKWHSDHDYIAYRSGLYSGVSGFEIYVEFTKESFKHFLKSECGYEEEDLKGKDSDELLNIVTSELSRKV